jgi:hypothetical protein
VAPPVILMQIDRKTFPGLYWLGRCFVSFLAAAVVTALLESLFRDGRDTFFLSTLVVLWIVGIVSNIPKWIGRCLDRLPGLTVSIIRTTIQTTRRALAAFIAAMKLIFWPVVAVFLVWKLCEWVWRIVF